MDMLKITEQAKSKLEKLTGLTSPAVIALATEEDHWLVIDNNRLGNFVKAFHTGVDFAYYRSRHGF